MHARIHFLKLVLILSLFPSMLVAQRVGYWQQEVDYKMEIDMDVKTHQFSGTQELVYTNNSPDTLKRFYYLLYFNAFQPNSMMDVRSRTIVDPDRRVRDRIYHLSPDEIGYHKIQELTQNGKKVEWKVEDTVLEVELAEPIPPGAEVIFNMSFESQVPLQIRRSGRDNAEGIDFSMSQWYPKAAEYDDRGWQAHPYIGREFYPVWGRFDVKITLDADYTVGATGILQNAEEIGHGYKGIEEKKSMQNAKNTWHFIAEDVHDFAWGADEAYTHEKAKIDEERTLHLFYVDGPRTRNWKQLAGFTIQAFDYLDEHIGKYPWPQFSVVQGGDGGMEYPNLTLITGNRSLGSLVGVTVHELLHSWFQGLFSFDETHYSWMDEGFTSYYSNRVMAHIFGRSGDIQRGSHNGYHSLAASGLEEPLTTHSDHYDTNFGYGRAAYSKGAVFLDQLEYVIGQEAFEAGMKRFYQDWAFKHPRPMDLLNAMEATSGIELDWYFDQWIGTTNRIDYAITKVEKGNSRKIHLKRMDKGIMPIDLKITYAGGVVENHHIPLGLMRGAKSSDSKAGVEEYIVEPDWQWTKEHYTLELAENGRVIEKIEIDPTGRLADYNRLNNTDKLPVNTVWMKPIRPDYFNYQHSIRPSVWYGQNAGAIAGLRGYGVGFQGDRAFEYQLMLSTGDPDEDFGSDLDVDLKLSYTKKINGWGNDAELQFEAYRFFGISDLSVTLRKGLHPYSFLSPRKRTLSFKPFLVAQTATRQVASLDAAWERGEVYGFHTQYEVGDSNENGYRLTAIFASHNSELTGSQQAANSIEWVSNRTIQTSNRIKTRFGLGVGLGSQTMPNQFQWTMVGPTAYGLWRNEAWSSVLNLDDNLASDLWLVPGNSGLEGYGHPENSGNVDIAGNNYVLLNMWNTWKKNTRSAWEVEFFAAAGRSWDGAFIKDNPIENGSVVGPDIMISSGFGLSYDLSSWAKISNWVPQSDVLKKSKLSIRVPFYMNGLPGGNDFTPRLLIGISDSF